MDNKLEIFVTRDADKLYPYQLWANPPVLTERKSFYRSRDNECGVTIVCPFLTDALHSLKLKPGDVKRIIIPNETMG